MAKSKKPKRQWEASGAVKVFKGPGDIEDARVVQYHRDGPEKFRAMVWAPGAMSEATDVSHHATEQDAISWCDRRLAELEAVTLPEIEDV